MEEIKFDVKKVDFSDVQGLTNAYIDALHYYYDRNNELVKENMQEIEDGNMDAIIPTFKYVIRKMLPDGKSYVYELSKNEIFTLLKKFIDDCILDYDIYISKIVTSFDRIRYNISAPSDLLGVKNRFGDIRYYNTNRLEYLRSIYKKVRDKDCKEQIKEAKKSADKRRNIFQRDGLSTQTNYTFASHIEYKYFMNLFIKDYHLEEDYNAYVNDLTNNGYTPMNKEEYFESRLDQEIAKVNILRKRK